MTTGIIVFAHGSRIEPANEAVRRRQRNLHVPASTPTWKPRSWNLAAPTSKRLPICSSPVASSKSWLSPTSSLQGLHLERDLPVLVENISNKNKQIQILVTASLDGHPGLVEILADRARAHG